MQPAYFITREDISADFHTLLFSCQTEICYSEFMVKEHCLLKVQQCTGGIDAIPVPVQQHSSAFTHLLIFSFPAPAFHSTLSMRSTGFTELCSQAQRYGKEG